MIVLGENGRDEYGWAAKPGGYYLYALEYYNEIRVHLKIWGGTFVSDEAFFWSTGQEGSDASGYGVSAYPKYAGTYFKFCGIPEDGAEPAVDECDNAKFYSGEMNADPLYTDPRLYGEPPRSSRYSGNKGSARSIRCVQD